MQKGQISRDEGRAPRLLNSVRESERASGPFARSARALRGNSPAALRDRPSRKNLVRSDRQDGFLRSPRGMRTRRPERPRRTARLWIGFFYVAACVRNMRHIASPPADPDGWFFQMHAHSRVRARGKTGSEWRYILYRSRESKKIAHTRPFIGKLIGTANEKRSVTLRYLEIPRRKITTSSLCLKCCQNSEREKSFYRKICLV